MGNFFAYTLYSGVFLLLLYLLYRLFLSGEKQIALNRAVLLGCYAVSFAAWPLTHIDWHSAPVGALDAGMELDFSVIAANTAIAVIEKPPHWPQVILWIYLIGSVLVLAKTLYSIAGLMLYMRKGERIRKDGHTLIIMPGADTAPFSFGNFIVMSEADHATVCDTIAAHELAHIRYRHYLDLLLAQTVCVILWYNPASWLMRDELKLLHEYQADAEVLGSGTDEKEYQMLLIRKTAGNRFHTLANNLNHNKLKNRIAMMQKEKSSGLRSLRLALLVIAPVAAIGIVNIPAVAGSMKCFEAVSLDTQRTEEAAESVIAAEFPGGTEKLMEFLALNLRYPEIAQKENIQGRPIVSFTIETDGTLTGIRILKSAAPSLDEEALRVVGKMPKWTPSMIDGKPVATEFALPVLFRLNKAEEKNEAISAGKDVNFLDEVQVVAYGAVRKTNPEAGNAEEKGNVMVNDKKSNPVVFVDGERMEKGVLKDIDPKSIESINVDRESPEYPDGRIDIKLKQPHAYIDATGPNARLIIGPTGGKDCDNSAYEVVRVDGKILAESVAINIDDIESFNEVAPCDEYPNGLLDIKMKKK